MDLNTLTLFPRNLPVVLPERLEKYLGDLGFTDMHPLCWGERTCIGSLLIVALPVNHFPGRSLCETRSIHQSYIVQGTRTISFAGDSGLTQDFCEIGANFSIDLALSSLSNDQPYPFRRFHMKPEDDLKAMAMIGARRMVPIYGGAFRLRMEGIDKPRECFGIS